jgi:regulator of protease activity HflC (stomatin/prohibitin superfamily)
MDDHLEKTMKRSLVGLLALASLVAVGCTRVGPGYVGIKVSMAGDSKGVDSTPAVTGWTFYNPAFTSVFEYPTFNQTAVWTKNVGEGNPINEEITFTNADQMVIAVDVNLSYGLDPVKVPAFYVKFRSDNLETFTHGYLRNAARDAFNEVGGRYKIEQIMGDNSAFIAGVKEHLKASVAPYGVLVDQFGIIGAPRPPQAVSEAINMKVHATQLAQQKQNELIQVEADAKKQVAQAEGAARSAVAQAQGSAEAIRIEAEAQAKANRLLQESLTGNLLELKRLEKWNGELPYINGGSTNPFVSLERKQ